MQDLSLLAVHQLQGTRVNIYPRKTNLVAMEGVLTAAKGMSEGDSTTVWVHLLKWNTQVLDRKYSLEYVS